MKHLEVLYSYFLQARESADGMSNPTTENRTIGSAIQRLVSRPLSRHPTTLLGHYLLRLSVNNN